MKLKINPQNKSQPDPFIFADGDKFYLYVTAGDGVEAYESNDIFGEWKYIGIVTEINPERKNYWAPSVIMIIECRNENSRFDKPILSAFA